MIDTHTMCTYSIHLFQSDISDLHLHESNSLQIVRRFLHVAFSEAIYSKSSYCEPRINQIVDVSVQSYKFSEAYFAFSRSTILDQILFRVDCIFLLDLSKS